MGNLQDLKTRCILSVLGQLHDQECSVFAFLICIVPGTHIVAPNLQFEHCRIIYKPGPVATGMDALLTVEFVAESVGPFKSEVQVKSEVNVMSLTVTAEVVPAKQEQQQQPKQEQQQKSEEQQDAEAV